jgi:putative tryptophan/tyrosine transport system substrate-binding protein
MRRREFIALLGGASGAWPLAARAQQPGKLPTIGVLGSNAAIWRPWMDAFVQRLRELDWIEGRTILIEYRWADARPERVAEIAAEFVGLKVDVILTAGPNTAIAKQATSVIPIVFAITNDPVGGGLVASLAQPGGNVTGLSLQATDLSGKRVELLRELVPQLRRLAVIGNVGFRDAVLEMANVRAAARALGLEVVPLEIQRAKDITPFAALNPQADALYVVASRFAPTSPVKKFTPVTLPPGRFRLATRPSLTGSPPAAKTIGTDVVAALAASAETRFPAITATGRWINSATNAGSRSS